MLLIIFTTIGLVFPTIGLPPQNRHFRIALTKLQFFLQNIVRKFLRYRKKNYFCSVILNYYTKTQQRL